VADLERASPRRARVGPGSPTALTIAIRSQVTSAGRQVATIRRSRGSSIVTDTDTSDVVTTSTAVRCRANTSNTRCRKPCAISIRVEAMSMRVTPRLQAMAVRPCTLPAAACVMRDPARCGALEFRIRTGMPDDTAGRMVLGCSTLAPK
jgi:hypothetical protein